MLLKQLFGLCKATLDGLPRVQRYSQHVAEFQHIIGAQNVQTSDIDSYNTDWLGSVKGKSSVVLFPRSTEDVSNILKYAFARDIKCVVQSGNTSLVAGAVPVADEVVISMGKMNKVLALDDNSGVLECEAGCVLQNIEEFVNERGRLVPYDLGAKGSCMIGGNVATNAGGLRFIRYGPLHGNVLGLEVVMPNGDIVDLMSSMRKDNTGYHLRHLFIGSEGTLGIITKVAILCPIAFKNKIVSLIAVDSFEKLLRFYTLVQQELGEYLSCFEMMDQSSIEAVVDNLGYARPIDSCLYPFYVMFELSTNDGPYLESRLLQLFERLHADGTIRNGTYASDSDANKCAKLRSYRENITLGLRKDGAGYKYDVSIPLGVYYKTVEVMRQRLQGTPHIRICGYGHIGDCNLHFNVTSAQFEPQILQRIEPFLYEFVRENRGSISAEHGIGYKKRQYLSYSKSREAIELMKRIKGLVDSKAILNPNKMF